MHLSSPRAPLPWLARLLTALALLALVTTAYHAAPANSFHLDDVDNIVRRDSIHMAEFGLEGLSRAATEGLLPRRVIPNVSFAVDWWRGGGDAKPFQITNIAIHYAATLATLALLFHLLKQTGVSTKLAWASAAIGAAAWALHPIQAQAVTYIVQRMTALAALFMILAVLSYLKARTTDQPLRWFALGAAASLFACLSKENAFILPLLILLTEYAIRPAGSPLIRNRLDGALLATPILAAVFLFLDLAFLDGPAWQYVANTYAQRDFTLGERLLTQPRVIFFHIGQLLAPLPERFSIEHDFELSRGLLTPWTTAPAIAGLVLWIAAGLWLLIRTRHRIPALLILWVPITLSIESSFIPLEMIFEHRMYLPSVALAGGLALGLARAYQAGWRRVATLTSVAILGGFLSVTLVRVPTWKTSVTLYEHASRTAPGSARVWSNLATAYEREGRSADAIRAYDVAIGLAPGWAIPYLNRGSSHRRAGNFAAAERDYRHFMALEPKDFRGPYTLGSLLLASNRYTEAEAMLNSAAALQPQSPLPHRDLAEIFLRTGRPSEALAALEDASRRDPAIVDANYHESFGVAHARLGHFGIAADAFGRALSIQPDRTETRVNLAYALLRAERLPEAIATFDKALAGVSGHPRALAGLAESLARVGRIQEAHSVATKGLAADPQNARLRQLLLDLSGGKSD